MNKKELEVLSILATQYTYQLVQYIDVDNIILRDKYGTYKTRLSNLRKQSYPSIISAIDKNEVFINKAKDASQYETELQNKFKAYQYSPRISFSGKYECFTPEILEILNDN